jgi:hypothetical protein
LTKQTGQNVSTGVRSQIKVLTEVLEKYVKGQGGCRCCQGGYQGLEGGQHSVNHGVFGSRQGCV